MNQYDTPAKVASTDGLGPAVPQDVMTYLHAYGDSRADEDGLGGLRIAEAILALRRWSAAVQAAERERCARLCATTPWPTWGDTTEDLRAALADAVRGA